MLGQVAIGGYPDLDAVYMAVCQGQAGIAIHFGESAKERGAIYPDPAQKNTVVHAFELYLAIYNGLKTAFRLARRQGDTHVD